MAKTLYEFYTKKGQKLPSIAERAKIYESSGLGTGYAGTASQNLSLLQKLSTGGSPVAQNPFSGSVKKPEPTINEAMGTTAPVAPSATPLATPAPVSTGTKVSVSAPVGETDYSALYDYYKKAFEEKTPSESAIKAKTIADFQAEIDSVKGIYGQKLNEARIQGEGRLGSARATQARSGLLGSDFGAAQTDKTISYNTDIENSILDEQNAAISAILNSVRNTASAEIEKRRKAKEEGAANYLSFLGERASRRKENLSSLGKLLVSKGIKDISDIDKTSLDEIKKTYGITEDEIGSAFQDAQLAQAKADKDSNRYETLGDGQYLYDTVTGEIVARNEKSFSPNSGGKSGLTPYQQFQATQSIAKDTQNRTENAREISRQSQLIIDSYNNIIGGGDRSLNTQAIITSFNKILDPTSVVRESEYDRTAAGQSLLAQLEGKLQNIVAGGAGVTEATLKEAVDIANKYLQGAKQSIASQNERGRFIAEQFGLNPDIIASEGTSTDSMSDDELLNSFGL